MEQIYVFYLSYHDERPSNGYQEVLMRHNQHAKSKEHCIDVLDTWYDGALAQAKDEYRRLNPCGVFGKDRPMRVIHWENA